jgi:enterochelin esterase-like enzyme
MVCLAFIVAAKTLLHAQAPSFLDQVRTAMETDPSHAESLIRAKFKPADLAAGIAPYVEGTTVLFAVSMEPGDHTALVQGDSLAKSMLSKVGKLDALIQYLPNGFGSQVQYVVDDKPAAKTFNLEVYAPNAVVETPPGGLKGELRDMGEWKSGIYPGTTRKWYIYLPPNLDPNHEYPLLLGTDAQWDRQWIVNGLENCARDGRIPPTVGVFIEPGQDRPGNYSDRSHEYDVLNGDYSNFLLTEILPQVEKIVKLSHDPSQRATIGVSSGGICGFTTCWLHPDLFSTVISAVGSFDDIAHGASLTEGGHNYPFILRLSEKKPIRMFFADGSHDLDNQFGNWFLGAQEMAAALKFKGYDYKFFPGQGFHSTNQMRSIFDQALVFWNGKK